MNLFDVESLDRREHFLSLMIVAFILSNDTPKDRDEFVRTAQIVEEMQSWRFSPIKSRKRYANSPTSASLRRQNASPLRRT
jgi:hypothetical protein